MCTDLRPVYEIYANFDDEAMFLAEDAMKHKLKKLVDTFFIFADGMLQDKSEIKIGSLNTRKNYENLIIEAQSARNFLKNTNLKDKKKHYAN